MASNGQLTNGSHGVLHWPGRLLSADDVSRRINGERELVLEPRAIVTPLAAEQLRQRGIRVLRGESKTSAPKVEATRWGYAQERPDGMVRSAVQALRREGVELHELTGACESASCHWARRLAECLASGACRGGVVFCHDPGLICCVANKIAGVRAASVTTIAQTARVSLTLGANLVAVEMPGRTFFELRQIFRILCLPTALSCPDGVACTLRELDGHAHR
jgi:hypothetical protein